MRLRRPFAGIGERLGLTRQVALLSLVPIVALGFILTRVLQSQTDARTLADATRSARLITTVGIQPSLTRRELQLGMTPAGIAALDHRLLAPLGSHELARIKIWSPNDRVIYSDDHSLIGRTLKPSDDLEDALAGHPREAAVVNPTPDSETAGEVGLGTLVEVYVPLRFASRGPPAGAFEIYLSYRPIAAAVSRDKRTIVILIAVGLALLWAILYRIVARASRRLRRQARENYRLARYDPLTGLPNRTRFIEGVGEAIAAAGPSRGSVAVLLLDLDRFKEINNTLGGANGDRVLLEVTHRLGSALGQQKLLARLGADEFAVLCTGSGGDSPALDTAAKMQTSLEEPVPIDGVALSLEASIGIAIAGEDARDPDTLLRRADIALAKAREDWSRVEVYAPESDRFDAARLQLLGEVRGALQRRELVLHYQPQVDLQGHRVTAVEALLRWEHPQRGLLGPMEFVPLIEQTALIGPVTLYVIDEALAQMVRWRRLGVDIGMSVNLSVRNLLDPLLPGRVGELLRRHGIPADRLTVEVTESAAMTDPARAVHVLDALRESGIRVSIDDFGTGNASIEYLAALPASELKIDRSFITNILHDPRAEAIVRSTIDLARNLGLAVVAEGIETEDVLSHLAVLGCDRAQGYFIARPLPAEEVQDRLTAAFGVGASQLAEAPSPQTLVSEHSRT